MRFSKIPLIFLLFLSSLWSCRKAYVPDGEDYSSYAWDFFKTGDYADARHWFHESVIEDPGYADGFNGLAWTLGRMDSLEKSVAYYSQGLQRVDSSEVANEMIAGRMFTYHALGDYRSAATDGEQLLILDSLWVFSRDETLNYQDVIINLAGSYIGTGDFQSALTTIQKLDPEFTADITTPEGQTQLVRHIEYLNSLY